ncbi:hypothetical protein V7S43_008109 [Phytophthora oleae]|uniref:Glycoside hydrolase n=1 Tax=Phytophthora oleae TaxID=2107226 RepID=A0ABD3FJT2_9STRA
MTSSSSSSSSSRSSFTSGSSSSSTSTTSSTDSSSESLGRNDAGYENSFNPVIIKGNRFFNSVTGDYFAVRGVNYYPRPNAGPIDMNNLDLFSNDFQHIWGRDLPQFTALGANVIRLYAVDPDVDHTDFMCALQAEGIYVVVDLGANCEGCEITADAAPACYPASYKARGERIISEFARYDNVMAFSGGNEINHRTGGNPWTWNAPCQKKFIRDMRAFLQSCSSLRQVPVGLVVADTDRDENALYYNCRTDQSDELENAQWYGINTYVHCEDISDPTKATGFNLLRDSFKSYDYSIPVVLTEFGCVSPNFPTVDGYEAQRTFHDAKFMNLPEYSDYFAGGVAFEYSTENANSMATSAYPFKTYGPQNYGLGYFSPEDCTDAGTNCTYERFPNFDFLKEAYTSYDSSSEPTLSNYAVPSNHVQTSTCPKDSPVLSDFTWEGDSASGAEACPSKTEARYQCPNLPSRQDGSLHLDEINSGSGNNDSRGGTVVKSGVPSGHEGVAIRFLMAAFAMIAFYL